jgi:tRNA(Ile)-lysidine synthase
MNLSPLHPFEERIDEAWPASSWRDTHIVLAVSGGADSVALLRAFVALKDRGAGSGRLFVAHLNHGLRGNAADADAEWLRLLCEKLAIPIEIGKADVAAIADREGDGWEAAARGARYKFLQAVAERLGARFVAAAHTADDQVETVLHRIVRGTGIAGLAGIRETRPLSPSVVLVRPMLTLRRTDVLEYLAAITQEYRTDETNAESRWTRNRLRHEMLPALRRFYNGDVDNALLRLAAQAAESQQIVETIASALASDCTSVEFGATQVAANGRKAVTVTIDCPKMGAQPGLLVREACRIAWADAGWPQQSMGFHQWQQLADLVQAHGETAAINLPGGVRAVRDGSHLILQRTDLS